MCYNGTALYMVAILIKCWERKQSLSQHIIEGPPCWLFSIHRSMNSTSALAMAFLWTAETWSSVQVVAYFTKEVNPHLAKPPLKINGDLLAKPELTSLYNRPVVACMFLMQHDDVIKWKHFPRHWPFVRGIHRFPVNSPHKGQWREALMFSLICVWINRWVNNREAGDLRRHLAHYDVTVMSWLLLPDDHYVCAVWWHWQGPIYRHG